MELLHTIGETICDRYQIVKVLGSGGVGTTYQAFDLNKSQKVAIKAVSLRQTSDWKALELFEREAKVLASLSCDRIPQYLNYFELETSTDKRFYLVQELVEGKSLADLVKGGWHATEAEIKNIAVQLLDILIYLHSFDPPVIHRDIKPQNIIRQKDGKVYLVDFGAVQDIYRNTVSLGKTFVGTLGYMSLEQLRGKVTPPSDLYSLGCTLLFLIAHKSPTDLPQKGMKIDFKSKVNVSNRLKIWLDKMLEPIVEDRFQSAQEALDNLQAPSLIKYDAITVPANSKIVLTKDSQSLEFKIPLGVHTYNPLDFLPVGFKEAAIVIFGLAVLPEITVVLILSWFFYIMSNPKKTAKSVNILSTTTAEKYIALEVNPQTFCLKRTIGVDKAGKAKIKMQQGFTANILWVNTMGGEGTIDQVLISGGNTPPFYQYTFGDGHISKEEAIWIAQEVSAFIEQLNK